MKPIRTAHSIARTTRALVLLLCAASSPSAFAQNHIWFWGFNPHNTGPSDQLSTYTQVASGWQRAIALRNDGSILKWGDFGATPRSGNGFVQIDAGDRHFVALHGDGSIHSWGSNDNNQVSGTPSGTDFVKIAAGGIHSLALRSDGSIVS